MEEILAELERKERMMMDAGYSNISNSVETFLDINRLRRSSNVRLLRIKYRGRNVIQLQLDHDIYNPHARLNKARIQSISNKLSSFLHDEGHHGMMSTSLQFSDLGWRSGYLGDFGTAINLYEPSDSDKQFYKEQTIFNKVDIYIFETGANRGGLDIFNDCFFDCITLALLEENPWETPQSLKKFLKIERGAMVGLEHIPAIEAKLKTIAINITGDHSYTSIVVSNKVINIKLINEHFTLNNCDNKKIKRVSYREKKIIMYSPRTRQAYDGEKYWDITGDEIRSYSDHIKSEHIVVRDPYEKQMRGVENSTLKDSYDQYIKDADILKKETKGVVNLYKTGEIKHTSLNLFDKFSKTIVVPEQIEEIEAKWIHKSSIGAIISFREYEGEAYQYDFKSMYPFLMNSIMLMPVKRGEFKKITTEEFYSAKFYQYGIYKCKIYKSDDENTNKLFRFNFENYYSHFSLNHAKILGLKIELIINDEPNFLYYSRDKCLTCHEVFGKFIDFCYDLKEKKLPFGKMILNILWGALGQKLDKKMYSGSDSPEINITDAQEINYIKREKFNDDRVIISYYETQRIYYNNFARFCPFLIARGRLLMGQTFFEHKDNFIRIHTDSFLSPVSLPVKCGVKMGDLVCEYSPKIIVKNNAKPEGDWIKI